MALKGKLYIETALREEKTILKSCFYTPPFKIADVTEDKSQGDLKLMLMSSSPGVLDGDEYHIQIDVNEKCHLEISTQSYQRLFQMQKGAKQFLTVHLKKQASLIYLPHPSVPHRQSMFFSKNRIAMNCDSDLIWGEIMSCGRKINGEVFRFSSYHNLTEIFFDERLVVKENILIRPAITNIHAIGQQEGFTHQANLICVNSRFSLDEKAEGVVALLQGQQDIEFGISALPVHGILVRLLGYRAEQLFHLLKMISSVLVQKTVKQNSHVA